MVAPLKREWMRKFIPHFTEYVNTYSIYALIKVKPLLQRGPGKKNFVDFATGFCFVPVMAISLYFAESWYAAVQRDTCKNCCITCMATLKHNTPAFIVMFAIMYPLQYTQVIITN